MNMQPHIEFQKVAGKAATFELLCRIILERVDATKAHSLVLAKVINEIIDNSVIQLTNKQKQKLLLGKDLRNKIIHSDLFAARQLLDSSSTGGVVKIDLDGINPPELVSNTTSTQAGSFAGWLFELQASGILKLANLEFTKLNKFLYNKLYTI